MGICTYCGKEKSTDRDHVIPVCLFIEPSNDRSIKVPSCCECNCKAEEGLLKSFFSLFDERIAAQRLPALLHPQGKGDREPFLGLCTQDLRLAYPNERLTRVLKKMFQGLRRHLLKTAWSFVSACEIELFMLRRRGEWTTTFRLPLEVGDSRPGWIVPPAFCREEHLNEKFRDFRYGMASPGLLGIKYARTNLSNELNIVGLFLPDMSLAPDDQPERDHLP